MIYAICGRPRSGKSYESVVFHIIPAIKDKRKVITNVSLNIDWFVKMFGSEVKDLIQVVDGQLNQFGKLDRPFSKFEHYQDEWRDEQNRGALYVVDEAHMVLPNRSLDASILEFYSLHGHYGIDIILLTQDLRKIHRDVKAMIEMTYYCAKNTAFGSDSTYTKKVRIGATTETVNTEQRKYKKAYFPAYQSHTQSKGSVAEVMAKDIKPIWKSFPFVGAAVCLTVGLAWFISSPSLFGSKAEPEIEVQKIETSENAPPVPVANQVTVVKKTKNDFGPLDGYDMFVTGYSKQIAYTVKTRNSGELNRDLSFYKIYLAVFHDGTKLFDFEHLDLQKIGYQFTVLGECVYQLTWHETQRIITCADIDTMDQDNDNALARIDSMATF